MNPVLVVKIFLVLSIGVVHSCHLLKNNEPSPPPPPPCPEPSPSPPPCPEPSPPPPPPPCPEPSPPPSPCPEPSPSPPPCPEPSPPPPPSPCPEPSPSPSPCPPPQPDPCPSPSPSPYPSPPSTFGDLYSSESYQTRSSSSSKQFSETSSSYSSTVSSPAVNSALYQDAFNLASICDTEAELYLKYLGQLSGPQMSAFDELIEYFRARSFVLADSVTDFNEFQNEMNSIYQQLFAQSVYSAHCDWTSQTDVYQQIQANLVKALSYISPNSCLYELLNFANTDNTYIPLVVGTCCHLVNLQNQYLTSYSASSSYQESSHQASSYQTSSSSSSNTVTIV